MTAITHPHALASEVYLVVQYALAEGERMLVDLRRVSLLEVALRWGTARVVRFFDERYVEPILRAPSPAAMHAAIDERIPAMTKNLERLGRGQLLFRRRLDRPGSWERVLELTDELHRIERDPEAVARLRVALAAHALAFADVRGSMTGTVRVHDEQAFARGGELMVRAVLPLVALLAWAAGAGPCAPDVLEALGERVVREADEMSAAFARATSGPAERSDEES